LEVRTTVVSEWVLKRGLLIVFVLDAIVWQIIFLDNLKLY